MSSFREENIVRELKKLGTPINHSRMTDTANYSLSILSFEYGSKGRAYGQLGVLTGLLLGEFACNSISHAVSWISHESKRPVKSVPSGGIPASSEAIDESKSIALAYSESLGINVRVHLCVDSKNQLTSQSTQRI